MSCLAPCPACNRHVSSDETACPFCSAALPDSFRCQPVRRTLRERLSRAGLIAAGATLIGVGQAACSSAYGTAGVYDAGADTNPVDSSSDGGPVALYGAAPPAFEQAPAETGARPPAKKKT